MAAVLVILSGLPGVGKTAIARKVARRTGAVHLRIDSIEQAIRNLGVVQGSIDDAGYRVAYALAEDNLRLGRTVIADSVNPIQLTRDAWIDVARRANVQAVEIEIVCTDANEHRRRVETRTTDVSGLKLPTWNEVLAREYAPWNRVHLIVDTASTTLDEKAETILETLRKLL
jgi:predicted kinase